MVAAFLNSIIYEGMHIMPGDVDDIESKQP